MVADFKPAWLSKNLWKPLGPDSVHLWKYTLDRKPEDLQEFSGILSSSELQAASRLLDPQKAAHRIASRGILRKILEVYANIPASDLHLTNSNNGKPHLQASQNPMQIEFNLSHSGNLGVILINLVRAVGIDIEQVVPIEAIQHIHNFLPVSTNLNFDAAGLLSAWVTQEAALKAMGCGWQGSSQMVDHQHRPAIHFSPAAGYIGAICIESGFLPDQLTAYDYDLSD